MHRAESCPAVHFQGLFSPQEKISKLKEPWENEVQVVRFNYKDFQIINPNTQITINLGILRKSEIQLLTFDENTSFDFCEFWVVSTG